MATANLGDFLRRLTRGMAAETLADHSDQQLVETALAGCGEASFQAIVHRHGAMVYRVCWRVLQHPQDAEDAFQATFLILAQKLRTLRKHASLASWLHGVAHRVALKAKAQSAARRRHERQASPADTLPADDVTWGEFRSALDSELSQLPDKWRLPLILCYLEGRTQEESASQLGWSKTTLRRRLQEARAALGGRLTGRGIAWSAAIAAVLLSDCIASAVPAPWLIASTVDVASDVAAGKTIATVASAKVAALTEGVVKTMFLTKLKTVAAILVVALGVLVGGGALFRHETIAAQQAKASVGKGKPESTQPKLKTEKRSETFALEGIDLVKGIIKGSSISTNPERTFFSHRGVCELLVKPTTKITIDGKEAKLADLKNLIPEPNSSDWFAIVAVEAELDVPDGPKPGKRKGLAIRIDATGRQQRGVVQAINTGKSTVNVKKIWRGFGGDVIYDDAADVQVAKDVSVKINDREAKFGDLKPNMKVSLQMSAVNELVLGITAYGATVEGVLKAVDIDKNAVSVTIPSAQMTAEGVSVAKYAKVVIDAKEGKLSDLKAGMRVTLQMSAEPDQSVIIAITKEKESVIK